MILTWGSLFNFSVTCYDSYEDETYNKWTNEVETVIRINLEKPLLIRNKDSLLLALNFDPEVSLFTPDRRKRGREKERKGERGQRGRKGRKREWEGREGEREEGRGTVW